MTHKICTECGQEYAETLEACPNCKDATESTVTIFGYSGSYAINPDVKIFKDGNHIATVSKNGKVTLPVAEPCELLFKVSIRSTKCEVKPGDAVMLDFDNNSGKLRAFIMNEAEAAAAQEKKIKESDSTLKVWIKTLFDIFVG